MTHTARMIATIGGTRLLMTFLTKLALMRLSILRAASTQTNVHTHTARKTSLSAGNVR